MSGRRTAALRRVNPVAKLLATLPVALALFVTRGPFVPAVVLGVALVLLVGCGGVGTRRVLGIAGAFVALATAGSVLLGLWVAHDGSAVLWRAGPVALSTTGLATGAATSLRVLALGAVMMLSGLTTTAADLLLALQHQLRVPYRYVYAARTALVIAPFMAENLRTLTLAHKVRGTVAARGPAGWAARQASYVVPLMAGGIRHGERLALAMDARAFGVGAHRTERRTLPWRRSDPLFVAAGWVSTAALYAFAGRYGLLGALTLW